MGLVVEAYFDGREPVTLQGRNPFVGRELDPITLAYLAEWFGRRRQADGPHSEGWPEEKLLPPPVFGRLRPIGVLGLACRAVRILLAKGVKR